MADYSEQLDDLARGPKQMSVDGTTATAQDVDAVIRVEDRSKSKASRARNHLGLMFRKIAPGGGGL